MENDGLPLQGKTSSHNKTVHCFLPLSVVRLIQEKDNSEGAELSMFSSFSQIQSLEGVHTEADYKCSITFLLVCRVKIAFLL